MNIHKRHALRLALYLSCVQISPQLSGHSYRDYEATLARQFQNLPTEIRREARRTGRRLIREANGLEAAACHLVPAPRPQVIQQAKWQRRCARYLDGMRSWSAETPPCPQCRIFRILPKRSWPNREQAEAVRQRQNDPRLAVYECPVQPGFWHLGHLSSKAKQ